MRKLNLIALAFVFTLTGACAIEETQRVPPIFCPNPGGLDTDGDGRDNNCDEDDDGDGMYDMNDPCPLDPYNYCPAAQQDPPANDPPANDPPNDDPVVNPPDEPTCPNLVITREGHEIVLRGSRAEEFRVTEWWDDTNNENAWSGGIVGNEIVRFPIPDLYGFDWFIPYTGTSESNRGSVLLVPDPEECTAVHSGVYLCGDGVVHCLSLSPCTKPCP